MGWIGAVVAGVVMVVGGALAVMGLLLYTVGPVVWLVETATRRRRWSAGKDLVVPPGAVRGDAHRGGRDGDTSPSGCGCGG
jgi:hypothetical protein